MLALLLAAAPDTVSAAAQDAARAAVEARVAALGRPMAVRAEPVRLPSGATDVLAVDEVPGPLPRARVAVPVRVRVDGHPRIATVHVRLQDVRRVPTWARAYRRGTPVSAAQVIERAVDLAAVRGTLLAAAPPGGVLARDVGDGAPLQAGDIAAAPVVARGDAVVLEVTSGRVVLRLPARALESGARGERIQVLGESSPRAVRARILDSGRVAVDE